MTDVANPLVAFNFEVQLSIPSEFSTILCNGAFAECDGLEMTMEPKTIREGGNNLRQIHLVGPVSYGNLTLKRGMTTTLDLWKWFRLAAGNDKRNLLAQGVVVMNDPTGASERPVLRFKLSDCLPIKLKAAALNAKDGTVAIEELQITYAELTLETA